MKAIVEEVLVDLILEDLMTDGTLFEANPYHDAAGKFTSKGATDLYQAGALAFGRAKGLKATVQGLDRVGIRVAIKGGIEQHLSKQGDREAGQKRLGLVRSMAAKGTLPPAPKPKAPTVRAPRAPKEKATLAGLHQMMSLVKKQHSEALQRAADAVQKIKNKKGDQIQARKDWNQAHADMAELRGKLEGIQKKLQVRDQPARDAETAHGSPSDRGEWNTDHQAMSTDALTAKLKDLQQQHADAEEEHHAAQAGVRERATHSGAGRLYRTMAQANDTMAALKGQMAQVENELKKRGKA